MIGAARFAAAIAARHRVRRGLPRRGTLVFARRPALGAPRQATRVVSATPVPGRLQLVLAPRVSVTIAEPGRPAPAPMIPARLQLAETRVTSRQIERLIERAHTLSVRRESASGPGAPAYGQRPAATEPAQRRLASPPMVLARRAAAAAAPAVAEPAPLLGPPAAKAAWAAPAPFEIERLADRVMASIDRRFVADRERKGRV